MSFDAVASMSNTVAAMGAETFSNMIELGFTLKVSLEFQEMKLGPILRQISEQIDVKLGSWGQHCYYKVLPHDEKQFKITCFNKGTEVFNVFVNYADGVVF